MSNISLQTCLCNNVYGELQDVKTPTESNEVHEKYDTFGSSIEIGDDIDSGSGAVSGNENVGEKDKNMGLVERIFGKDMSLNFRHELSYVTSEGGGVETDRSSLRLKWNRFLASKYYIAFDAKSLHYFGDDRKKKDNEDQILDSKIREFFVQSSWGNISMTVGKQIVVWGESETATVTDVFSPRNLSDFIFTSLDESRIGQTMFKGDYYSHMGQWTLLYNPNAKVDEEPPFIDTVPDDFVIKEKEPQSEKGFRWKRPIGRGDFSIMAADLSENQGVFVYQESSGTKKIFNKEYRRFQMLGGAANINLGSTGLEVETAYNRNRSYQTNGPYSAENIGVAERNSLLTALTVKISRNGLREWAVGLSNSHVFGDISDLMDVKRDSNDVLLKWSDKFFYETLSLSYTYQNQLETNNTIHNISGQYAFTDDLNFMLDGFVIRGLGTNESFKQDSLFFRVEYFF